MTGELQITNITATDTTISFCYNGNCTSNIIDLSFNQVICYPNPSTDQLFITLPEPEVSAILQIYDICGKNIFSEKY